MKWDRSWPGLPKTDAKYMEGCAEFIELAFTYFAKYNKMCFPCRDCKNKKCIEKDSVLVHLLTKGMYQDYARLERWHLHNEPRELPPQPRNDTDSQGLSDAVFHDGAEY